MDENRRRRPDRVERQGEPVLRERSRSPIAQEPPQQVAVLPPPEPIEVDPQPNRRPTYSTPPRKMAHNSSGINVLIETTKGIPTPVRNTLYMVLDSETLAPYFASIRTSLLNVVYNGDVEPDNTITEAQWITVCRWLTKARCDTIYSKLAGERRAGRISLPTEFTVPKALSDIINGIGVISVAQSAIIVCPEPEPQPQEQGQQLNIICNMNMRNAFTHLVHLAEKRGFINTGRISMAAEGTAWWMIAPYDSVGQVAGQNTDVVRVYSFFPEFTPADVMLAAIVRRGYNGLTQHDVALNWASDAIRGCNSLRDEFNLKA